MLGNKEIMAINIKRYMQLKGVNSSEVCKALGFKQNTFSNWINAKIYPRIDKIEMMADYFGVSKADLVEEHKADIDSFVDLKFVRRSKRGCLKHPLHVVANTSNF